VSCPTDLHIYYFPAASRRHTHPELRRTSYVNDNDIQWHGEAAFKPDWTDSSRLVAYTLKKHAPEGEAVVVCCAVLS
jgi:isoamylase/glycogen operon protein